MAKIQGNLISLTDPLNQVTTQSYDALNRLERLTDVLEEVTQYRYDGQDQLVSLTDPKGLTTTYNYDGLGSLLEVQSPDTGLTTAAYNLADRPKSRTDARGVTATLSYDVLNRLTAIDYPGTSEDVRFSYDQGTNGLGRLTQGVDESGTTSYAYNLRGLLKSVTTTRDGLSHTTGYGYTHGQLTHLTYPSGRTVDYTRDGLGRITTITTAFNGVTTTLASNIGYSPFGPMRKLTFGNGLVLTRSFDLDYRLTAQTTLPFQNLNYTWDGADNITALTSLGSLGSTQNFGYDALNRLWTAEASPYGSLSYDSTPSVTGLLRTTNGALASYQYPPESHRLGSITGSGSQHFLYDENGNTVDNSRFGFVYGQNNRLRTVTSGGATIAEYRYNGRGERVKKVVGSELGSIIMTRRGCSSPRPIAVGRPCGSMSISRGCPWRSLRPRGFTIITPTTWARRSF